MKTAKFTFTVEYDPDKTDPESLASALDTVMETAMTVVGTEVWDDYGEVILGEFFPVELPEES